MKNKILISIILIFIVFVSALFGQGNSSKMTSSTIANPTTSDINGIWLLTNKGVYSGKFDEIFRKQARNFLSFLIIEQTDSKLKIVEKSTWSWIDKNDTRPSSTEVVKTYDTNNVGEVNIVDGQSFATKTSWDKGKLIIKHVTPGRPEPWAVMELSLSKTKRSLVSSFRLLGNSKEEQKTLKKLVTVLIYTRKKQ